jgi:hypothetical protein
MMNLYDKYKLASRVPSLYDTRRRLGPTSGVRSVLSDPSSRSRINVVSQINKPLSVFSGLTSKSVRSQHSLKVPI